MNAPDFDKLAEEWLRTVRNNTTRDDYAAFARRVYEMGVEAEREACANIAYDETIKNRDLQDWFHDGVSEGARACATRIRARGSR